MLPGLFVFIYNEISLNGAVNGFNADIKLYYEIAYNFKQDAVLIGSNTAVVGVSDPIKETKEDFFKPEKINDNSLPYLIISDSKGKTLNLLHVFRRMEYCKDVIVLITEKTPVEFIEYLEERNYDYIKTVSGNYVDYKEAFNNLKSAYNINIIRSDSGAVLNNELIAQGLVNEIRLLIAPEISCSTNRLFMNIDKNIKLKLDKSEIYNNFVLLYYKIKEN